VKTRGNRVDVVLFVFKDCEMFAVGDDYTLIWLGCLEVDQV
jgi:hypothetical protein